MRQFKDYVKEKRIAAGLTQVQVASEMLLTRHHYQRLENGRCRIRIEQAFDLADIVGFSIDEFRKPKKKIKKEKVKSPVQTKSYGLPVGSSAVSLELN